MTERRHAASDLSEGRTPPPAPLGPSAWEFPHPSRADEHGVVGSGADLEPETLVEAYRNAIFPWPHAWQDLPWFSPDPRGIILPDGLHVSRSLRATLRRCGWTTTCDRAFSAVIGECAHDRGSDGTWITPEMRAAYTTLHRLGWAHSVEVWDGEELVGGLYGVAVGGVFTGESMFHRRSDASKVALCDVMARFVEAGGHAIDVQLVTPHLAQLGAVAMPRAAWLEVLVAQRDRDVRMWTGPLPAARLAQ